MLEERDVSVADRRVAFTHVADLVHPQSRQTGIDLARDRPGHARAKGRGLGGTSYLPRSDPREREHDRSRRS